MIFGTSEGRGSKNHFELIVDCPKKKIKRKGSTYLKEKGLNRGLKI